MSDWDKEQLAKYEAEQLKQRQGDTLTVLDALRRSRKARGGVGAPLQIPRHLQKAGEGMPDIVVTDADLRVTAPITPDYAPDAATDDSTTNDE